MPNTILSKHEPKILVISNNAFSKTSNNGKTLASFFRSFSAINIAQLYFSSEIPTDDYFQNHYQIPDVQLLKSIFSRSITSGRVVKPCEKENHSVNSESNFINEKVKTILGYSNFARIIRELIWSIGNWETEELTNWIDEFSPDVIFLCAGDSEFAYTITRKLRDRFDSKLIIYITDDYVLPRNNFNIFWWFRRNRILKRIRDVLKNSNLFITISKSMSEAYKILFNKESICFMNITSSLRQNNSVAIKNDKKDTIDLVYTGGLHFNRYKTLALLAHAIKQYNISKSVNEKYAYLRIYSINRPSRSIIKKINIEGVSKYCGSLNSDELKDVLNKCDIPVHVESFERKNIESTRLSISTKIPEYLSLGKAILAIGPKDVASMEYLDKSAYCINNPNEIVKEIQLLFKNNELQENLSQFALEMFNANHNFEKTTELFKQEILKVMNY